MMSVCSGGNAPLALCRGRLEGSLGEGLTVELSAARWSVSVNEPSGGGGGRAPASEPRWEVVGESG